MNNHIGKPVYFEVEKYLDTIEGFINADELDIARWLIKHPPSYYRDFPPPRLLEIKESLHKRSFTPVQYKDIPNNFDIEETIKCFPGRAVLLRQIVEAFNKADICPNLMEYASGNFWLAKCLKHLGLNFTYEWQGLEKEVPEFLTQVLPSPNIFIAFEIIEHLADEWEIYTNYLKFGKVADMVLLSTPLYTCAGGMDNWRERDLGHLRTYSPREFLNIAQEMFHGYEWNSLTDEVTIILMGKRIK